MPTLTRPKSARRLKATAKSTGRAKTLFKGALTAKDNAISTAAARRRTNGTVFVLSEAEITRINGAQESLVPMP